MVGGTGWVGGPNAGGVVAVGGSEFGGEVVGSVLVADVSISVVVVVVDPSSAGLVVVPMITDSTCGGSLTVVALAA